MAALVLCNLADLGCPLWTRHSPHCVSGWAEADGVHSLVPKFWPALAPPPLSSLSVSFLFLLLFLPHPSSSSTSSTSFFSLFPCSPFLPLPPSSYSLLFPPFFLSLPPPPSLLPALHPESTFQSVEKNRAGFLPLPGRAPERDWAIVYSGLKVTPTPCPPQCGYLRKGSLGKGEGIGAERGVICLLALVWWNLRVPGATRASWLYGGGEEPLWTCSGQ